MTFTRIRTRVKVIGGRQEGQFSMDLMILVKWPSLNTVVQYIRSAQLSWLSDSRLPKCPDTSDWMPTRLGRLYDIQVLVYQYYHDAKNELFLSR